MILGLAGHGIPHKSGPPEGRAGGQGCRLHTYSHRERVESFPTFPP